MAECEWALLELLERLRIGVAIIASDGKQFQQCNTWFRPKLTQAQLASDDLESLLKSLAQTDCRSIDCAGHRMCVVQGSSGTHFLLLFIKDQDDETRRKTVLVAVRQLGDAPVPKKSILHALYGFSPAETRVALLLSKGCSVNEIASATNTSEGTVRTHMKSMFQKAGVKSQAALLLRIRNASMLPSLGRRTLQKKGPT